MRETAKEARGYGAERVEGEEKLNTQWMLHIIVWQK